MGRYIWGLYRESVSGDYRHLIGGVTQFMLPCLYYYEFLRYYETGITILGKSFAGGTVRTHRNIYTNGQAFGSEPRAMQHMYPNDDPPFHSYFVNTCKSAVAAWWCILVQRNLTGTKCIGFSFDVRRRGIHG